MWQLLKCDGRRNEIRKLSRLQESKHTQGIKCENYLNDILVGSALVRLVILGVLEQHLVHVRAGVLEQLVGRVEDDQCNLTVAQDTQLIGLLHQSKFSFGEGHL